MKIERRRNTLLSITRRIQDAREIRMEKSEKKNFKRFRGSSMGIAMHVEIFVEYFLLRI